MKSFTATNGARFYIDERQTGPSRLIIEHGDVTVRLDLWPNDMACLREALPGPVGFTVVHPPETPASSHDGWRQ